MRLIRLLGLVLVLTTGALIAWRFWLGFKSAQGATKLLSAVQQLQLGKATLSEVQVFAQARSSVASEQRGCVNDQCEFQLVINNHALSDWFLAPQTEFRVSLHTTAGVLTGRWVFLNVQHGPCCEARVIDNLSRPEGWEAFNVTPKGDGQGTVYELLLTLSPQASKEQRAAGYRFQTSCLYRIGGCRDARQLLPGVYPYAK